MSQGQPPTLPIQNLLAKPESEVTTAAEPSQEVDSDMDANRERHETHSSFRETVVEHLLLAQLLARAWHEGRVIEVARAETDQFGYDLVLTEGRFTRHVQVKASAVWAKTSNQTVHTTLQSKPSPCIVWVVVKDGQTALEIDHFLFFGGAAGEPMPDLGEVKGVHPRGKNERPATRKVKKSRFHRVETTDDLMAELFGHAADRQPAH